MKWLLSLVLLASACAHSKIKELTQDGKYPASWFEPAPEAGAPGWEILPQAAKPGEVVLSKRNELGLLSNFAATPFEYRGKKYASVEGFWQSTLYPENKKDPRAKAKNVEWKFTRDQVAAMTAFDAKHAGALAKKNMEILGIDWNTFEDRRMTYRENREGEWYRLVKEVMRAKLEQNPKVCDVLYRTGDLRLLPDHHEEPNAPPAWRYFDIWMELRSEREFRPGLARTDCGNPDGSYRN